MGVHLRRPQNSWRSASGRGKWGRNRSALARDSQHGVAWGGGEGRLLSYLVYMVVKSLGTVYLCLSLIFYTCDQVSAVSSLTCVTSCMSGVPPPGERGRGGEGYPWGWGCTVPVCVWLHRFSRHFGGWQAVPHWPVLREVLGH